MTVGQKIAALRKARGMTQEELSEVVDVTRQTISKWELDVSTPDLDSLCKLCDLFGVTADYLIRPEREVVETAPPRPPQLTVGLTAPLPRHRLIGAILLATSIVLALISLVVSLFTSVGILLWYIDAALVATGLEMLLIRQRPWVPVMWTAWIFWLGWLLAFAHYSSFVLAVLWLLYSVFCIFMTVRCLFCPRPEAAEPTEAPSDPSVQPVPSAPRQPSSAPMVGHLLLLLSGISVLVAVFVTMCSEDSFLLWYAAAVFLVLGLELRLIRKKPWFPVMWTAWGILTLTLSFMTGSLILFVAVILQITHNAGTMAVSWSVILSILWLLYTVFCIGVTVTVILKRIRSKKNA